MQATYIGSDFPELFGKTALVRQDELYARDHIPIPRHTDYLLAQFDDLKLGEQWTHTWEYFPMCDFSFQARFDEIPINSCFRYDNAIWLKYDENCAQTKNDTISMSRAFESHEIVGRITWADVNKN